MADDDQTQDQADSTQREADSPEALSVHTLAPVAAGGQPEPPDYMPLFVAPQPIERADDDDVEDSDDFDASDDEQADRPAGRRRRRGRRGRGRGRGDQGPADGDDSDDDNGFDNADTDDSDDSDDGDDDGTDDDAASTDSSPRRRRRRRRKTGSGGEADTNGSPDDPPNTVVHERPQRSSGKDDNEIQSITGSTRLEAKRQRRRDGRDAGRRRPPILSEAEFLARREAVERVMVVRDKVRAEPPHEGARYTQIAVLEDGMLVEHFVTSTASASLVGNIYLGIVQNVLPSMEAAFVDIGRGRNGVLYAGEVNWEAAGLGGTQPQDRAGPEAGRPRRRPGEQGPGRAQGRPADHAGVVGRPVSGVRAGRLVDGHQPQVARHRTPAAQGDSARGRAVRCGCDHQDRIGGREGRGHRRRRQPPAGALADDRAAGIRDQGQGGRGGSCAVRGARRAGQGRPGFVQ